MFATRYIARGAGLLIGLAVLALVVLTNGDARRGLGALVRGLFHRD